MRARWPIIVASLGPAATLAACEPVGYPSCYRVSCPYPAHPSGEVVYVAAYPQPRRALSLPPFDDPAADYSRRSLMISQGSGNDQAANLALQTSTPWPHHSQNTSIPGNGARMVKAVNEFESGTREAGAGKRSFEQSAGAGPGIQNNLSISNGSNDGGGTP